MSTDSSPWPNRGPFRSRTMTTRSAAQQAAKADVEGRQAALNTSKVNQTAAIQQAQAAVAAANATIRQAELNVEYCNVTSPITGIAGTRLVAPGNLVGQGEATLLTTVSNVNPMRVYVSISERDYLIVPAHESPRQA